MDAGISEITDDYRNNLHPHRLAAVIEANKGAFDVIQSDDRTLLLDLDTPEAITQFERVYPVVQQHFGVTRFIKWKSKSGNTHVLVTLSDAQPMSVRFALQAALGSDGVREALSLKGMLNGCVEPSLLFKPKEEVVQPKKEDDDFSF